MKQRKRDMWIVSEEIHFAAVAAARIKKDLSKCKIQKFAAIRATAAAAAAAIPTFFLVSRRPPSSDHV